MTYYILNNISFKDIEIRLVDNWEVISNSCQLSYFNISERGAGNIIHTGKMQLEMSRYKNIENYFSISLIQIFEIGCSLNVIISLRW